MKGRSRKLQGTVLHFTLDKLFTGGMRPTKSLYGLATTVNGEDYRSHAITVC